MKLASTRRSLANLFASGALVALTAVVPMACDNASSTNADVADVAAPMASAQQLAELDDLKLDDDEGDNIAVPQAGEFNVPVPPAARVQGTIAGIKAVQPHAVFVEGELNVAGRLKALIFIVSDNPDMCAHLQAGTMPKNAQMTAMAAFYNDYGKPAAGQVYLPAGATQNDAEANLHVYFRQTNASCGIDERLGAKGATAEKGGAKLTAFVPNESASLTFKFEMMVEDHDEEMVGPLKGEVNATYCHAPNFFEHAQDLFLHGIAAEKCR